MSKENLSVPNPEFDEGKPSVVDAYAAYRSLERWLFYRYPTTEDIIAPSTTDEDPEIAFVVLEDGTFVRPGDIFEGVDQSNDL